MGGSGPGPGSGAAYTPGSRIAGYRLEEEIGAGGMAVVFRARDDRLDRLVALKLLTPWLAADEDFRHRFLRESRAAAAVDDPHIIPVYEAGEAGGVLYLAMRYVSGGDIRSRLRRDGPFTAARAAGVLSPVASALDAAHAAGLVHRDVKPANVLVDSRPGRPDHVYLSDFGLAKTGSASVRLTRTGLNLGTVSYMAPEQIEGREVDGRADQYALACAAFELLAGVVPFERDQDVAVLYAHLSEPPPSLAARRPGVPAAADEVLARALAKAADDRYPTCRHFTDALRQAFGLPPYDHDPGLSPPAAGGPPAAAPALVTDAPPAAAPALVTGAPPAPASALVTGGPPAPAPAAPAPGPHGAPATQIASQRPGSVPAGASASSAGRGSLRSGRVLASPLTTFVGRTEAVQEVAGLLQGSRLVTVTGPGGVGKTRLAIEVARQQAGRFADGACLVELAAVSEPALVPATVAAALGIPQAPDLSATESLAAALHRLQVLLVLDNCEHLIPAVADLCELLLPVADDARFLATSQEPLRAGGETRYRLAPLSVPRPGEQAEAAESEAVRLFTDRARRVDPHFDLDPESAAAVARVVARLDGMPLAIELAAARVEALGLTQLLNRLDDRFALLASGDRRASARQRSLAATVDWSYQLLDGEEQQVFRRLSVIPGPFTLEATTAVAGPGAESAVLRLVDCSLLSPPRVGRDGRPRYLMLETLRAYGAGRLAAAGEQQAAAARLAEHALALATQAAAELQTSAGELAAARWLDTEDATTQQALAWALEHDPGLALRLAVALASWWVTRGRVTAGYPLLLAAAEGAPRAGEAQRADDAWAAAQYWLGYFANLAGDFLGALKHYALAISAVADDPRSPVLADATSGRANCLLNLRRNAEAAEEAERALDLARDSGYPAGEARALLTLSIAAQYAGDEPKALDWARQATRIDPRAIPGRLARQCNDTLADILVDVGDLAAAEDTCVTELDRARQAGDLISQSFCLDLLAELDQRTGRIAEAGTHLRESLEIATRIGNRLRLIDCLNNCGHLCAATGRPADAVTIWAAFVTCLKEIGMSDLPAAQERRREPLRAAQQALGPDRTDAAEKRGREMTLATAAELATLLAGTDARAPEVVPDLGKLSAKERELVTLVAQGRTDAEIAAQLHLTVRTVRSRVDRIRAKAGCPRRADLIRLALQAGLV